MGSLLLGQAWQGSKSLGTTDLFGASRFHLLTLWDQSGVHCGGFYQVLTFGTRLGIWSI